MKRTILSLSLFFIFPVFASMYEGFKVNFPNEPTRSESDSSYGKIVLYQSQIESGVNRILLNTYILPTEKPVTDDILEETLRQAHKGYLKSFKSTDEGFKYQWKIDQRDGAKRMMYQGNVSYGGRTIPMIGGWLAKDSKVYHINGIYTPAINLDDMTNITNFLNSFYLSHGN